MSFSVAQDVVQMTTVTAHRAERLEWIDILKGTLLVYVVFGHTIPAQVSNNMVKWLIYSFHMPCFFWVSGYLTTDRKLNSEDAHSFVRASLRWLLPWSMVVPAWSAYQLLSGYRVGQISEGYWQVAVGVGLRMTLVVFIIAMSILVKGRWKDGLGWIIVVVVVMGSIPSRSYAVLPWLTTLHYEMYSYHLWFVPTLFLISWALRIAHGLSRGLQLFTIVSFFLTAVYPWLGEMPGHSWWLPAHRQTLLYCSYFVLGYWQRNRGPIGVSSLRIAAGGVSAIIGVMLTVFGYGSAFRGMAHFGALMFNVPFVLCLPPAGGLIGSASRFAQALACIGRDSLWIYLLHPFITFSYLLCVGMDGGSRMRPPISYVAGVGVTLLVFLVVWAVQSAITARRVGMT